MPAIHRISLLILLCGLGGLGCSSKICSDQAAMNRACGATDFNLAGCESALRNCTEQDQQLISEFTQCVNRPAVCSGGRVVDANEIDRCGHATFMKTTPPCFNAWGKKRQ